MIHRPFRVIEAELGQSVRLMRRVTELHTPGQRFSVRASISLWMLVAGLVWITLGLAITYAVRSDDSAMEAAGHRLSTIAPAAGSASPAVKP